MTLASVLAIAVLFLAMGALLYVRFRILWTCPRCSGWGALLVQEGPAPCWLCRGKGSIRGVPDTVPLEWQPEQEVGLRVRRRDRR